MDGNSLKPRRDKTLALSQTVIVNLLKFMMVFG